MVLSKITSKVINAGLLQSKNRQIRRFVYIRIALD